MCLFHSLAIEIADSFAQNPLKHLAIDLSQLDCHRTATDLTSLTPVAFHSHIGGRLHCYDNPYPKSWRQHCDGLQAVAE